AFSQRVDDASASFAQAEYGEARTAAVDALQLFEKSLAYSDSDDAWARYRQLLVVVAEAQLGAKDVPAADVSLSQVLAVDPDYAPSEPDASAVLVARVAALRQAQKRARPAVLEVLSRPPGARVLVDGRAAGRAPVAVDVSPGIHYVLVDDEGRTYSERVVVGADGARVSARLGSPQAETAALLTRALREPITKREFTNLARDVADITFVVVVVPYGPTEQVLCARVTRGQLDAVVGTRLPLKDGPREKAMFALVDAAMTRSNDGWVGVDDNVALLRTEFLQGAGNPKAVFTESDAPNVPLIVGGIAGGVVVVVGVGLGVLNFLGNEQKKDTGFTYGIDVSGL
ncbi:hypothetical protein DAPPUDRAFT_125714, partial [Daphnia pulex]